VRLIRPRSLELQLILRVGALFLGATALAVVALLYQTYSVAESLSEQNLLEQARVLARAVNEAGDGGSGLALPRELVAAYEAPSGTWLFAVRDDDGDVIAASDAAIQAFAAAQPPADTEPEFFHLRAFGAEAHGGNVTVSDNPGGGTRFSLRF